MTHPSSNFTGGEKVRNLASNFNFDPTCISRALVYKWRNISTPSHTQPGLWPGAGRKRNGVGTQTLVPLNLSAVVAISGDLAP